MDKIDAHFYDKRLQDLKQAALINYPDDILFMEANSKDLELLDVLLNHLVEGDLDFCFQSKYLLGVEAEEKEEIYKLARKYVSLCFYGGKVDYWLDSVEGVTLGGENAEFVCMKILENYDFLLGIARDGGEAALNLIQAFQSNSAYNDGAVIDVLRNDFEKDDLLSEIIVDMAKDDGDFAKYNDYQKSILCMYPNGVLFRINEEDCYEKIPVEELDSNLANYLLYNLDDYNLDNLLKIVDERTFKDAIFEMHFNSINKKSIK